MWTLRRACTNLRNRGLGSGTGRICSEKPEIARCCLQNCTAGIIEPQEKLIGGLLSSTRFYNSSSSSSKFHREVRTFSSQAGAKSSGEDNDDLEDGFSELETPLDKAQGSTSGDESDDSKSDISEEDVDDDLQNELETFDTETAVREKKSRRTRASSAMTKVILASPASSVSTVLNKWVEEGNEVTQTEVSLTMLHLRKRRMFVKALQLLEWLESKNHLEFVQSNYASRVDLIAKLRGVHRAEEYLKQIPESSRDELVYRTLLANCVSANNVKKSEGLFNKMKSLGLKTTSFSCNQLLLLYKRTDKKKIGDVLLMMEKENIKPTVFTYQVLIDAKGQSNDIPGMEEVVQTMKTEGLAPSTQLQASLARHYVSAGLKDKAESVLKEMEGEDITKNRLACPSLMTNYASLGKADEVARIWKVCESDPWLSECVAAIEAWGQLGKIENAEAVFEQIMGKVKKPSSKQFTCLLKVYANHKMLAKGKDLVKRMAGIGCQLGPLTWDALVKLYVGAGEVEKADTILEKATKQKRGKPLFSSYLAILDKYASKGDVHNAEKTFVMMRQAGYTGRIRQYQALLQAYITAKKPAYGFSDRMKADNIFPNRSVGSQLARVDPFRKSPVAELLE